MPRIRPYNLTEREWLIQRFWQGVFVRGENECWPWLRAQVTDGYGTVALKKGVPVATHRLCYEIHHGEIPIGMSILHTCDNPPCCNPKHLILGDAALNAADRTAKKGKLHPQQVEEIKKDKRAQRTIAADYGITQSMVCLIKKGERWNQYSADLVKERLIYVTTDAFQGD